MQSAGSAVTRTLRNGRETSGNLLYNIYYIIIIPKIFSYKYTKIAVEIELEVVGANETFFTTILKRKKSLHIKHTYLNVYCK